VSRTGPYAEYRQFLAEGRFMIQRCRTDGRWVFYPRVAEPASGHTTLEWQPVSGLGRVYSTTTVRPRPPERPYNVALIDLAEGPRMMSRVEGIEPGCVRIGMPVRAEVVVRDAESLVIFRPK